MGNTSIPVPPITPPAVTPPPVVVANNVLLEGMPAEEVIGYLQNQGYTVDRTKPPVGPSGTPVILAKPNDKWFNVVPTEFAYQPSGSPWWVYNLSVTTPVGPASVSYYPDNFPRYTSMAWSKAKVFGGYPELVIGVQGPNNTKFGRCLGPGGEAALPSWVGQPLSALSQIMFSWDVTINDYTSNVFNILTETWLGPANSRGHEVGFILKRPEGWWPQRAYQHAVGGVNYYFVPNAWLAGSLAIMPASVYTTQDALMSGSVDLLPILAYAASRGWTSMAHILQGWEFGAEWNDGSGSVTFNSIGFVVEKR